MPSAHEHLGFIIHLVRMFRPHTYVELGVQQCYTFNNVMGLGVVKRGVAVDIRLNGVKKRKGVECYQMSTDEFSSKWEGKIDFLFIDADHSYGQVKKDFFNLINWVPHYTGLVLLHDTYPLEELETPSRCGDAWKLAHELHRYYPNFEIVTLPGPTCGLSIVRQVTKSCHIERHDELYVRR